MDGAAKIEALLKGSYVDPDTGKTVGVATKSLVTYRYPTTTVAAVSAAVISVATIRRAWRAEAGIPANTG